MQIYASMQAVVNSVEVCFPDAICTESKVVVVRTVSCVSEFDN